jgi:hypothetical protein
LQRPIAVRIFLPTYFTRAQYAVAPSRPTANGIPGGLFMAREHGTAWRKAGETREIVFDEPLVILTGVPRGPDREKDWGPLPPTKPYDRYAYASPSTPRPAPPVSRLQRQAESSVERQGPHRIIVQVRAPDPERGDHGEVAEGTYTVAGNVVRVEDMQGRSLGGQVLRPEDDPRVVARLILRTTKAPEPFWAPINYH